MGAVCQTHLAGMCNAAFPGLGASFADPDPVAEVGDEEEEEDIEDEVGEEGNLGGQEIGDGIAMVVGGARGAAREEEVRGQAGMVAVGGGVAEGGRGGAMEVEED